MASLDSAPPVRNFQFDSSGTGELKNNVNLFRGDVNYPHRLFNIPGRASEQGLDVDISLYYQSNVHTEIGIWNRDQPTGVVGLGWMLPLTFIEINEENSQSPEEWSYVYSSNGEKNELIREPETPLLFDMDKSYAGKITVGAAVPQEIRTSFVSKGLALDSAAIVRAATETQQWTIEDAVNERLYFLQLTDSSLKAFCGGQSFQLRNYKFWRILYYPQYEKWEMVNEAATISSFGGGISTTDKGYKTSTGNSIVWGVSWLDAASGVRWIGNSTLTQNQSQYAKMWYLSTVSNMWGDKNHYTYNDWQRDATSGLLPVVEQLVGQGGLPYTKAVYLSSIEDVFGRKALFSYGEKLWSNTAAESPREYSDPHKVTPDNMPNAYQDRYETKFLQTIEMVDVDGTLLFGFELDYSPRPEILSAERSVAKVLGADGDLYKRFLTRISHYNQNRSDLPPVEFTYYLDPAQEGANPGALQSITYTDGAVANYRYTRNELDICNRTFEVNAPPETGLIIEGNDAEDMADGVASASSSAVSTSREDALLEHVNAQGSGPRVWFGKDYAVTCWYNTGEGKLSLMVATWLGYWKCWQLDPENPLIFSDKNGLAASTLDVVIQENCFALHFEREQNTDVYVFRKDAAQIGAWQPADIDGVVTKLNVPTLSYSKVSSTIKIMGGDNFLLASLMNPDGANRYERLTWRWDCDCWSRESFTTKSFSYIISSNTSYFVLHSADSTYSIHTLETDLQWQDTEISTPIAGLNIRKLTNLKIASMSGMAAITYATNATSQIVEYGAYILQWGKTHAVKITSASFSDPQETGGRYLTGWDPVIVNSEMVAINWNIMRYNGATWLINSKLAISRRSNIVQRYAYGPDYVLQILVDMTDTSLPEARLLSFDPNSNSAAWSDRNPVTPLDKLPQPVSHGQLANWPATAGDDYFLVGPYLYYRNHESNWDQIVTQSAMANTEALVQGAFGSGYVIDTKSVVAEAPLFLTYSALNNDVTSSRTGVILLENGKIKSGVATAFPDESVNFSNDSGARAGGPLVFASFPSSAGSFANAKKFVLHRHAGNAVSGYLTHYAISNLNIDNGFGEISPTSYYSDPSSATCDPSGEIIKYFKTSTFLGSESHEAPKFGCSVDHYINSAEAVPGNFYDMLNGMLQKTEIYDNSGTLLKTIENTWQVFTHRATEVVASNDLNLPLYGGFVCQVEKNTVEDGVQSRQVFNYCQTASAAPYSGKLISTDTYSINAEGSVEKYTTTTNYAYAVDAGVCALHLFDTEFQKTTVRKIADGPAVTVLAAASMYKWWPSQRGEGCLAPAVVEDFNWAGGVLPFPHGNYDDEDTPAGWLPTGKILVRTVSGLPQETADGVGMLTGVLYGAKSTPVVQFKNASVLNKECAYASFQSYEADGGFVASNPQFSKDDAFLGEASLSLVKDGALAANLTAAANSKKYVLGYWYKTPKAFSPLADTGWHISLQSEDDTLSETKVAFDNTDGKWVYRTIGISLSLENDVLASQIAISAQNKNDSPVLIGSVVALPLNSTFSAQIIDPRYHSIIATWNINGQVSRNIYDDFQRSIGVIGSDNHPKEIALQFLSRNGEDKVGVFDPVRPNSLLKIHPASGGSFQTFQDGDGWMDDWIAEEGDWKPENAALVHFRPVASKLSWNSQTVATAKSVAMYFEVSSENALSDKFGIVFGNNYRIYFLPGTGLQFVDDKGAVVAPALAAKSKIPRQWLLILGYQTVLFYADGQLMYSHKVDYGNAASLAIESGNNIVAVRKLTIALDPRVSVEYSDGARRDRQMQHLWNMPEEEKCDGRILAVIYDVLDRKVAVTKMAPSSFGSGANNALLAYSAKFVDVADFLKQTGGSWKMSGDVADYYTQGNGSRPDDEGYSYYGYRYDSSPLGRQLETGQPGKERAIHDIDQSGVNNRKTFQYEYGSDQLEGNGSYQRKTTIGPDKVRASRLTTMIGHEISSVLVDTEGKIATQSKSAISIVDGNDPFISNSTRLPNSFKESSLDESDKFIFSIDQDSIGRTIKKEDPTTGKTEYFYTATGRLRFMQMALEEGETGFIYYKYDVLGRTVEEGTVQSAWDREKLSKVADDENWPTDEPHVISRSYIHDGDGNIPVNIGRKIAVRTFNPKPVQTPDRKDITIEESYTYDVEGRPTSVVLVNLDDPDHSGTMIYHYNNLGDNIRIDYPAGSPVEHVFYDFNDQGWVAGISTNEENAYDIAAYTYDVSGKILSEARNNGLLVADYKYTSQNWLEGYKAHSKDLSTDFFEFDYTYGDNWTVQQRKATAHFNDDDAENITTYAYDSQKQFLNSTSSGAEAGDEKILSYDANGNILELEHAGDHYSYVLMDGSDRLLEAQLGPLGGSRFYYSADGWLKESNLYLMEHSQIMGLNTYIKSKKNEQSLRLCYGQHGLRTFCESAEGPALYIYNGMGNKPYTERKGDTWKAYIYGPTGTIAIITDKKYFPIEDHQQTLHALVDENNQMVAKFEYTPFGFPVVQAGKNETGIEQWFLGHQYDENLGLYLFGSRLYDPCLRRFCSPDPNHEFASPYLFIGNNPLSMVDPTGNISGWGLVGTIAISIAIFALGFVTLGTSTPAIVAGAAAVAETAATEAATATIATEAAVTATASASAEVAAAQTTASVAVAANTTGAAGAAASETWGVASNILGGMVKGVGTSTLMYEKSVIFDGEKFSLRGLGAAAAGGAVGGLLNGVGAAVNMQAAASEFEAYRIKPFISGVFGAGSSMLNTTTSNLIAGKPVLDGFLSGVVSGFIIGAGTSYIGQRYANTKLRMKVDKVVDAAKASAKSGIYNGASALVSHTATAINETSRAFNVISSSVSIPIFFRMR